MNEYQRLKQKIEQAKINSNFKSQFLQSLEGATSANDFEEIEKSLKILVDREYNK